MIAHTGIFEIFFDDGTIHHFEVDVESISDIKRILYHLQERYPDFDFKIQIQVCRV